MASLIAFQIDPLMTEAGRLAAKYDWQLVDAATLVAQLRDNGILTSALEPSALSRLLVREYWAVMYAACGNAQQLEHRERAFAELAQLLYRVAYNKYGEHAEEVTQLALSNIFEKLHTCHCPHTYIDFALWKLREAATQNRRFEHQTCLFSLVHTFETEDSDESELERVPDEAAWVEAIVQRREGIVVVLAAISRLKNANQREIILLDLSEAIDDHQIAQRLAIKHGNVRKQRFDALIKLSRDTQLKAYFTKPPSL